MTNLSIFESLEDLKSRELILDTLEGKVIAQGNFFEENNGRDNLEKIFEDMLISRDQGRCLHQTWTQKIGNKSRKFSIPNKPLKRFINNYLLPMVKEREVHPSCHGGEIGWSVKASLATHLPFGSSLSCDFKSAFENIPIEYLFRFFYDLIPDNLSQDEREKVARFLTNICTIDYENKRGLPQGWSSSMAIFNRSLYELDSQVVERAHDKSFRYSRWVDDITISSQDKIDLERFIGVIELLGRWFPIAKEKIFFQTDATAFLLGYKLLNNGISKNSKEERLSNKPAPINFYEWFGDDKIKSYESWN